MKKVIAIIPARGGSKRIPKKNIRQFAGKPMIAHSIIVAQQSKLFDHIYVSSEDEEILSIAKEWGAEQILRPKELADDHIETAPVVRHAIDWMKQEDIHFDAVCCICATAPFILTKDLIAGWKRLQKKEEGQVFAATSYGYPIHRSFQKIEPDGLQMFFPEYYHSRSQDLPQAYHDAGQFGWGWKNSWNEENIGFGKNSTIIELPRWRVVDIDTEEDWKHAEIVYRIMKNK